MVPLILNGYIGVGLLGQMVFLFFLVCGCARAEGNINRWHLSDLKPSRWYLARIKWISIPMIGSAIQSGYLPSSTL